MNGLLRGPTPTSSDHGGVIGMYPLMKMPRYCGLRTKSRVSLDGDMMGIKRDSL